MRRTRKKKYIRKVQWWRGTGVERYVRSVQGLVQLGC